MCGVEFGVKVVEAWGGLKEPPACEALLYAVVLLWVATYVTIASKLHKDKQLLGSAENLIGFYQVFMVALLQYLNLSRKILILCILQHSKVKGVSFK